MTKSNSRSPEKEPPKEAPMPVDPEQDKAPAEDLQRGDPQSEPASPEVPEPSRTPEDTVSDPFDDGNFPV